MTIESPPRLTTTQWLIIAIAAIGFAFDIYELLMLPLVIKPALAALGGLTAEGVPRLVPGSAEYVKWARTLFFLPALMRKKKPLVPFGIFLALGAAAWLVAGARLAAWYAGLFAW